MAARFRSARSVSVSAGSGSVLCSASLSALLDVGLAFSCCGCGEGGRCCAAAVVVVVGLSAFLGSGVDFCGELISDAGRGRGLPPIFPSLEAGLDGVGGLMVSLGVGLGRGVRSWLSLLISQT